MRTIWLRPRTRPPPRRRGPGSRWLRTVDPEAPGAGRVVPVVADPVGDPAADLEVLATAVPDGRGALGMVLDMADRVGLGMVPDTARVGRVTEVLTIRGTPAILGIRVIPSPIPRDPVILRLLEAILSTATVPVTVTKSAWPVA